MRKALLSFFGAVAVSYLSLRILSPLIQPVFNFFDLGTPDQSEAAKHAFDLLLVAYGVLAIGIYGLFKRGRRIGQRIVERISDFIIRQRSFRRSASISPRTKS